MKVSYKWLSRYFDGTLPSPDEIARLLTFHSFEIESVEKKEDDAILDIAVLPNRAHDCLSHEGIAKEVATIVNSKIKKQNVKNVKNANNAKEQFKVQNDLRLDLQVLEPALCGRYLGRVIEGVKVGPSPAWLKERLQSIGQKSINNVVDAANFLMFDMGQPLHLFDADRLDKRKIQVRLAISGEKMTTLDGKELFLMPDDLIIADDKEAIALAGVKGGIKAQATDKTVNLILEAANFDPFSIRRTSRRLGLRTESSIRFENEITPEMAGRGMEILTGLIIEVAGTRETMVGEVVDAYPRKPNQYKIGLNPSEPSRLLGLSLDEKDIEECFHRLNFAYQKKKVIESVLDLAPRFIGVPYQYGASVTFDAPKAFDCSGLVAYLYRECGVNLPRMTIDQYFFTDRVTKDALLPGDLIFSRNSSEEGVRYKSVEFLPESFLEAGVSHVGLYVGNDNVIHASGTNGKNCVICDKLSDFSDIKNIVGYGRAALPGEERYVVDPPYERLDLWPRRGRALSSGTAADLIEEIGRVTGLEKINGFEPKKSDTRVLSNNRYYSAEMVRERLSQKGFSEIYGYAFSKEGELELENALNKEMPFLRANLADGIEKKLALNKSNADLLGIDEIKIFEIGNIFNKNGESTRLAVGSSGKDDLAKILDWDSPNLYKGTSNIYECDLGVSEAVLSARKISRVNYKPFSIYPFVVRDIAIFVPTDVGKEEVESLIMANATSLLKHTRLFDTYMKEQKISYAFRLVFQSDARTLTSQEVAEIMQKITRALSEKEWQIR